MKGLSIEQKAKAYDEALAKMREIVTMDDKPTIPHEIAYHLFPELKESEDERIRKELIEHVKDQQSSLSLHQIVEINMKRKRIINITLGLLGLKSKVNKVL